MTKNCHTKTFFMKKITSLLAIAAVALTAALSFGSCSKNDDPAVEPEPEPEKVYPVDSIVAGIVYEYSEAAIQVFDIKYEVTDFNGHTETFTVTEPGHVEKLYKTADVNAKVNVKLVATYKNNIDEIKTDPVDFMFQSDLGGSFYANGKSVTIIPENDYLSYSKGSHTKAEIEEYAKYISGKPFTYSLSLSDDYKKGVTESLLKEYGN